MKDTSKWCSQGRRIVAPRLARSLALRLPRFYFPYSSIPVVHGKLAACHILQVAVPVMAILTTLDQVTRA